jgi:hypothetical protein
MIDISQSQHTLPSMPDLGMIIFLLRQLEQNANPQFLHDFSLVNKEKDFAQLWHDMMEAYYLIAINP